jgi:hypothetical protein
MTMAMKGAALDMNDMQRAMTNQYRIATFKTGGAKTTMKLVCSEKRRQTRSVITVTKLDTKCSVVQN